MEAKEVHLVDRFLDSTRLVATFLKMTGVDIIHRDLGKRVIIKRCIWSIFWMLLNIQSGIVKVIRRKVLELFIALLSSSSQLLSDGLLTDHLNEATMRLSHFIFETFTHYVLVFTIRPTLRRLLEQLEPVDAGLGRPSLSSVARYSIAILIFTFIIASAQNDFFGYRRYIYSLTFLLNNLDRFQYGYCSLLGGSTSK